ncbi:Cell division protein FtsI Peptidoglycan synthetase [Corynebacterium camporealensis]|uniref:Cell division protein FtsI/penicillin-binding protein 2 n=1 Tax=Corynebacterium camporealensis TaxID=161896 RepID=A0A0F6QYY5_9CORY|nr:penicillin-binding protein 2 [Corynebacterium camporealensis]AKE39523.1 cell division protein FtsI/penicillin-binding protein 2 [Corynebacterium camporealensis]AVH88673.1 Cell division protein FtsI Peptidoglycan synthetase [Corynebacterium camporealensis]
MAQRINIVVAILGVILLVLVGRLAWVQLAWGPDLAAKAEAQRSRVYIEPARRGEVVDREGQRLAYTMQARSLTVSPTRLRSELREQAELEARSEGIWGGKSEDERKDYLDDELDKRLEAMADGIPRIMKDAGVDTDDVDDDQIMDKLNADTEYEVLVRNLDPDVAVEISQEFHGLAADHQDIRQYPNGAIAENVIGKVSMDGQGQFGFEASGDGSLTGIDGRSTEDVSTDGQPIPGTLRDEVPAVDGKNVTLTLDLDLQTYVQQKIEKAVANSKAENGEAVVLDVATGEVLAMANSGTIDPNKDIEKQLEDGKDFENPSISHPYEPGSVAKVITAAAALEEGATTPDEVHQVPGSIDMAGVTVNDAWAHGVEPYTTTGIFGKSSNVGTLMIAEKLGQEKYSEYLEKFGLGSATGIELPNESTGLVPALEQWSGGTFANLPIGQGQSWTTLQMASVYQALANGGERIEPRIIDKVEGANGEEEKQEEPKTTRVVSEKTAKTTVDMFRSVFQDDPAGIQNGTAAGNNIEGYELSGKTGTAQKVDPNTGGYSNSAYWITFAGIAPANDPRFVVAVMLDEPETGVNDDGSGGQSAAPVFKDIASWLLNRDNIPTTDPAPRLTLRE